MRNGKQVELFELRANSGATLQVCTYGATLVSWKVPDRQGKLGDVLLGFDDLASYEKHTTYIGCVVGRVASRISGGKFRLGGEVFTLPQNNGTACHHGGPVGFNKHVWDVLDCTSNSVRLQHVSPHLDQGFPGKLRIVVKYEIVDTSDGGNALAFHFSAAVDRPTVVNLTNHLYFNLAGVGPEMKKKLYDHSVSIAADTFVPVDKDSLPLSELRSVGDTPLDFRASTRIGERVDQEDPQLQNCRGIDHNMVLRDVAGQPPGQCGGTRCLGVEARRRDGRFTRTRTPDASATEPTSGRRLDMFTTEPAVHFYTGNWLGAEPLGKYDVPIEERSGFCFETQHLTDSPNQPSFPSVVLEPGKTWETSTVFWLTTDRKSIAKACGGCFSWL